MGFDRIWHRSYPDGVPPETTIQEVTMPAALDRAPTLDGNVIGDPAWSSMTPASDFWQIQPNDGQPSTQRTEVYIGYSDTALYVGVVAWDDDPSGIIVSDSRRDSS